MYVCFVAVCFAGSSRACTPTLMGRLTRGTGEMDCEKGRCKRECDSCFNTKKMLSSLSKRDIGALTDYYAYVEFFTQQNEASQARVPSLAFIQFNDRFAFYLRCCAVLTLLLYGRGHDATPTAACMLDYGKATREMGR